MIQKNQAKIDNQAGSWRPDDFEIFNVEKNVFDPVEILVSCLSVTTTTTTTRSPTTTKSSTIAEISYSQENHNEPTHCPPKVRIFSELSLKILIFFYFCDKFNLIEIR